MMKPVFLTQSQRGLFQESDPNHHQPSSVSHPPTPNHPQDSANRHRRDHERRKRERDDSDEDEALKAERNRRKEMEAIKEQYLGLDHKPKRRMPKPSERYDNGWKDSEDTSQDPNPLYQKPHESLPLFGRGFLGGFDRRVQKKAANERANQHWSLKVLDDMTERDWRIFKEDYDISYKGTRIPRPMRKWAESNLHGDLLKAVERAGYETPTPIQMAAIPLGLQQRDVIGVAETGSGKTAAFVLPMLNYIAKLPRISNRNRDQGPYAVVMAPTRELAQQIEEETVKLGRYLGIKVVSAVGGQPIQEQAFKISQGCEILIAAPGRLLDLLASRLIVLNQCNYVVLDEADRMIDMGFLPQVEGVLDAMPSSNLKPENEDEVLDEKKIYRTTYMFSATMSVEKLARKYLRNPVVVNIGTPGQTTDKIKQDVVMLKDSEKRFALHKLLYKISNESEVVPKILVFCNTKRSVDSLSKDLDTEGYRITTLHSGKSQEQRESSLESFRTKRTNIMVATDVAGRGIDIPEIAHVINYDMPGEIDKYKHRIGRTGRAGKEGVATTYLTLQDANVFYDLKQFLIQSKSKVPPELDRHEASKYKPGSIPDRPPRRNDKVFARY